ncbi:TadE family protein [Hyalangium versicolor]|uniref:TadE family protein n=1 Tax=Hyalangium versicolor TaxID=2861190 RepID=UPI001CCF09FC|nr:TadE family protein [Hyalangium versicolor]
MARVRASRRLRGQAVVELALGLTVFVTVLMFAIHFAEVGYISLKVTEASHSAMLDATGYKLHDWPQDDGPATFAALQAGQKADERYKDFDSRRSSAGSGTLTQVFTQATGMSVSCQIGGGPGFGPGFLTQDAYSDNGGMTCLSSADITAIRLPTEFLEHANQGFFSRQHYKPTPIHVCGIGRAAGGSCPGQLTTMLDDWGLSGGSEGRMCALIPDMPLPCANKAFWKMAASVHLRSGAGLGFAGSTLAQSIVGMLPFPFFFGGENAFWMSAMGEESGMVQPLPSEGWIAWPTSPGLVPGGLSGIPYTVAYFQRDSCFLGKDCP